MPSKSHLLSHAHCVRMLRTTVLVNGDGEAPLSIRTGRNGHKSDGVWDPRAWRLWEQLVHYRCHHSLVIAVATMGGETNGVDQFHGVYQGVLPSSSPPPTRHHRNLCWFLSNNRPTSSPIQLKHVAWWRWEHYRRTGVPIGNHLEELDHATLEHSRTNQPSRMILGASSSIFQHLHRVSRTSLTMLRTHQYSLDRSTKA